MASRYRECILVQFLSLLAPLADSILHTTSTSEATSAYAGGLDCQGGGRGGMGDSSGSNLTPEAGAGGIVPHQHQSSSGNDAGAEPAQPETNKVVNVAGFADDDHDDAD
eukprot:575067-Pleurochrysis_carterae.AAC.1